MPDVTFAAILAVFRLTGEVFTPQGTPGLGGRPDNIPGSKICTRPDQALGQCQGGRESDGGCDGGCGRLGGLERGGRS